MLKVKKCRHYLFYADMISFFVTRKCQKSKKKKKKPDLKNFNKIFRKDVTYDNIESHEKPEFPPSLEETFFEQPRGRGM